VISLRKLPNNVVFLSGVHGTGKSTLKQDLCEIPYIINYEKCEMTSFKQVFERQIRRIAKYRIDYERICDLAEANPDKIILADRCVYDAYAYIDAFQDLGWLTEEDYGDCWRMIRALFPTSDMMPNHVLNLAPPLDTIKSWLKKRQNEIGTKWNEQDEEYLETVYNRYERNHIAGIVRIREIDRKERFDICKKYLDKLYSEVMNNGI
jgi:deoxyadenosine/deoxycytidine kinase